MLELCARARRDGRPHVLIIDEINRGNLSKILGELMLLIEPDKRESRWALDLAYARPGEPRFWVPPNVHVIGTMNTADRSLALVDYALRRRFAFATVPPAFGPALRGFLQGAARGAPTAIVDKIFERLERLNAAIAKDMRNLGPGYLVGHSYFCQEDPDRAYGAAWYERIVHFEIAPLLEEYFTEDLDRAAALVDELLR
jgi:5-methylcytosine-specific restriction protein B